MKRRCGPKRRATEAPRCYEPRIDRFTTPAQAFEAAVTRLTGWLATRDRLISTDEPWAVRELRDLTPRLHALIMSLARARATGLAIAIPDPAVDRLLSAVASKLSPSPDPLAEEDQPLSLADFPDDGDPGDPVFSQPEEEEELV